MAIPRVRLAMVRLNVAGSRESPEFSVEHVMEPHSSRCAPHKVIAFVPRLAKVVSRRCPGISIMRRFRILRRKAAGRAVLAFLGVAALVVAPRPSDALTITPTFTAAFNSSFGVNALAAQNAWIAAANVFQTNFNDNIHINITVNGVPGTSVFGQSQTA